MITAIGRCVQDTEQDNTLQGCIGRWATSVRWESQPHWSHKWPLAIHTSTPQNIHSALEDDGSKDNSTAGQVPGLFCFLVPSKVICVELESLKCTTALAINQVHTTVLKRIFCTVAEAQWQNTSLPHARPKALSSIPSTAKKRKKKKTYLLLKKEKKNTSIHLSFWKYNINGLAGHIAARNLKKHNVRVKCTWAKDHKMR